MRIGYAKKKEAAINAYSIFPSLFPAIRVTACLTVLRHRDVYVDHTCAVPGIFVNSLNREAIL